MAKVKKILKRNNPGEGLFRVMEIILRFADTDNGNPLIASMSEKGGLHDFMYQRKTIIRRFAVCIRTISALPSFTKRAKFLKRKLRLQKRNLHLQKRKLRLQKRKLHIKNQTCLSGFPPTLSVILFCNLKKYIE